MLYRPEYRSTFLFLSESGRNKLADEATNAGYRVELFESDLHGGPWYGVTVNPEKPIMWQVDGADIKVERVEAPMNTVVNHNPLPRKVRPCGNCGYCQSCWSRHVAEQAALYRNAGLEVPAAMTSGERWPDLQPKSLEN